MVLASHGCSDGYQADMAARGSRRRTTRDGSGWEPEAPCSATTRRIWSSGRAERLTAAAGFLETRGESSAVYDPIYRACARQPWRGWAPPAG